MIFMFSLALFSREDPFVPLVTPKESMRPYYGETRVFDREEITLPSNARLIKKVEVTYQNIDGSIEKKSLDLSGRIDWRLPLVLSQTLDSPPKNAPKSTKSGAKNEAKRAKNAEDSHKDSTQDSRDSRGLDSPEDSLKDSPKNGAKTAAAAKSPAKDSPQKATNPKDSSTAKTATPSDDEAIFLLEESRTKLRKQKDSRESKPSGNLEQGAIIENAAISAAPSENNAGFGTGFAAKSKNEKPQKSAPQVATNAPTSAANHSPEKSSVQKPAANAAQSAAKKNLGADSARNSGANPANLSNPATAINRANPKTPATSATAANPVNPKSPANPAPAEPNFGANPEPKIVAAPPAPKNYPNPKNAAFIAEGKSLFIAYDGALQRHFMMKNPSRIVLDFDKNMSFYKPAPLRVDKPHFRSIRYGLHDGFLRVVVELEGSYVYGVAKMANGVVVNVE